MIVSVAPADDAGLVPPVLFLLAKDLAVAAHPARAVHSSAHAATTTASARWRGTAANLESRDVAGEVRCEMTVLVVVLRNSFANDPPKSRYGCPGILAVWGRLDDCT